MSSFEETGITPTDLGRSAYALGRRLVEDVGARIDEVIWDADEVLWDWVMSLADFARDPGKNALRGDWSHREFFQVRPGMLELLFGMHHASKEQGLDPWVRIWTTGYPWRIWKIAQTLPALGTLLGPVDDQAPMSPEDFASHPRLFSCMDYVSVYAGFLESVRETGGFPSLPDSAQSLLLEPARTMRLESGLKVPEVATFTEKSGFRRARILVDDRDGNVDRFVRTGRCAVRVASDTPRVVFGLIPNTVWRDPWGALDRRARDFVTEIGKAIAGLTVGDRATEGARIIVARAGERVTVPKQHRFTVDIPGKKLRGEWIDPIRDLQKRWNELAPAMKEVARGPSTARDAG